MKTALTILALGLASMTATSASAWCWGSCSGPESVSTYSGGGYSGGYTVNTADRQDAKDKKKRRARLNQRR